MGVTVNTRKARGRILLVQKELPFVTALALTRAASDGKKAAEARIPKAFDKPTKFTEKGIGIQAARKASLKAKVFVKDRQAGYLQFAEEGTTRTPQPGSPMNKPVAQRKNASGNIPYRAIARLREQPDVFVASTKHPRTAKLQPGIYRRPKVIRGDDGKRIKKDGGGYVVGRLKLIVGFKQEQQYKATFNMRDVTEQELRSTFSLRFSEAIQHALRNGR
jgi:hypothetical protein